MSTPTPRQLGLGLGALLLCSAAAAATVDRPPWLCSLSDDALQLVCIADPDWLPARADVPRMTPASYAPTALVSNTTPPVETARVNGTSFPLDPARIYTVDLYSPASDAEWLEQLAYATICYRSPGCQVVLTGLGDLALPPKPAR